MDGTEEQTLTVESGSPGETRRLGEALGKIVTRNSVVLLSGPLGAGKTRLAQGIGLGLGIQDAIRSPTFTLVNEYQEGRLPLYHVDLYRLEGDVDVATVGIEELFETGDGLVVVEWPERAPTWLPGDVLFLTLHDAGESQRLITITARGAHHARLLEELKQALRAG